jgi:hypothetical protein
MQTSVYYMYSILHSAESGASSFLRNFQMIASLTFVIIYGNPEDSEYQLWNIVT